jgi:two-component system nitrogen regulation response regulator GlnG
MNEIWIVDDDQSIRWVIEKALAREGFGVRAFGNASECLSALDSGGSPRVLVSDIRMPGTSGLELLQQVKAKRPATPVIIMTAYSDLDSAVSAFQGGAFDYLAKPFDLPEAVELIRRAWEESEREAGADEAFETGLDMLGQAPAMQEVFRAIGRLSQSNVTVLITGESGTGKELVARALHKHSPRAREAFVALNTAAIPRDLLESELFGHERGAFTGAQQMRRGRFEQAEGGTLFLDEIGDMPAELQTRLLRVLSDGQYYRVGGHNPLKANVRVIAATHQHLEDRVQRGLFREDLFHRLNVIRLRLPPLRERQADVPLLARHFLQASARELGGEAKRLAPAAMRAMSSFAWPGNVRQLENTCRWLTVMAPAQIVDVKDLPPEIRDANRESQSSPPPQVPQSFRADPAGDGPGQQDGSGLPGAQDAASNWQESSADRTFAGAPESALPGVSSTSGPMGASPGNRSSSGGLAGRLPSDSLQADRLHAAGLQGGGLPGGGLHSDALHGGTPHGSALHANASQGGVHSSQPGPQWSALLAREVSRRLASQSPEERRGDGGGSELMHELTREFESAVIRTALEHSRGRRIDAALRLGIGRNTITRKIQELRLEEDEPVPGAQDVAAG